jgi:hypothetical protein
MHHTSVFQLSSIRHTSRRISGPKSLPLLLLTVFLLISSLAWAQSDHYFQLKMYRVKDQQQAERLDHYFSTALVPALHRQGIHQVGVFRTLATDTGGIRFYTLIPFSSLESLGEIQKRLDVDAAYQAAGKDYLDASWDNPPYVRIETMILDPFPAARKITKPSLSAAPTKRVYELRSYEGPTERYHASKLKMFNVGDEISLFNRLRFNGIFYGEVIAGSHMPNLMYMTSFNSMEDRDAHWKAFFADPAWLALKDNAEYQHNVSKSQSFFLHPTDYSDL